MHLNGAAFVLNSSTEAAADHLSKLLHYDHALLADKDVQWEAQLLSQVSGHVFVACDSAQDEAQRWKSATIDASLKWLAVHSELAALKTSSRSLTDEVATLQRTVERLERNARTAAAATQRKTTSSARTAEVQRKDHYSGVISSLWQQGTHALRFASSHTPSTTSESSSRGSSPVMPQGPSSRSPARSTSSAVTRTPRAAEKARAPLVDPSPPDDFAIALMHQRMYDEESQLLALEREQLSAKMLGCGICSNTFAEDEVITIDDCRHAFCRSCLRNHVSNQLTARPYSVLCPGCIAEGAPGKMSKLGNSLLREIGIHVHDQYSVAQY